MQLLMYSKLQVPKGCSKGETDQSDILMTSPLHDLVGHKSQLCPPFAKLTRDLQFTPGDIECKRNERHTSTVV